MLNHLSYSPTKDQQNTLIALTEFISSSNGKDFMIINGSAGTGKTTILKAATDYLHENEINFVLCAPTGIAASIITKKTKRLAKTIHSTIYIPEEHNISRVKLKNKINTEKKYTIFFIDESSMVPDHINKNPEFVTPNPVLTDLMAYVKDGNIKNKVVFVGDNNQLPPVNTDKNTKSFSPALDKKYLEKKFKLKGCEIIMTQVMRQEESSPILNTANKIRKLIIENKLQSGLVENFPNRRAAVEQFLQLADFTSTSSAVIICRTNKDVSRCNDNIRNLIGNRGSISQGDLVQIQENSYYEGSYFTKGKRGIVMDTSSKIETYAGLNFQDLTIQFSGNDNIKFIKKAKVLLNSIFTYQGKLDPKLESKLIAAANRHNKVFRESQNKSDDKYLSALRLRHSYAITCQKAQGGEWDHVYIHPYMMYNDNKWLYTAVTRAKNSVHTWAA